MIKNTPAMGWNSWNTFGHNINEEVVLSTAENFVKNGYLDAGYEYIVIDDCWSLHERDKDGRLQADPEKFPHGMKYVADKIHALGLKFGMYSCAGTVTCAGYPASYEYEFIDAKTFAEWGVDYLKYDYCFRPLGVQGHLLYKRMGLALANSGRDILFSNCSWGSEYTNLWIKETGAHSFRSTEDIVDSWASIKKLAQSQLKVQEYNGVGCFNDMDMLVVGMNGVGHVGRGGCTEEEYFTHFALWCMCSSPLMIGCDVNNVDEKSKAILLNKDLIRIDQDGKGSQPFFVNGNYTPHINEKLSNENPFHYDNYPLDHPIIAKFLDDGTIALAVVNFADADTNRWSSSMNIDSLGIPLTSGKTLKMRNVRTGEVITPVNGHLEFNVPAHSTFVYICEVVDK